MSAAVKKKESLQLDGQGETKTAAFADALSKVQKSFLKQTQDVVLKIEPKDVTVLSAEEKCYTERFLFFFLPRRRSVFSVRLQIDVDVLAIPVEDIAFRQVEKEAPDAIQLPFLSKKL